MIVSNLHILLKDRTACTVGIVASILFGLLEIKYTNYDLLFGNFGPIYAYTYIVISIFIVVLIGLFIALHMCKIKMFKKTSTKQTTTGIFGGILGFLTTGCTSCTLSIASMIGLGGFMSGLPGHGIELKIISLFILAWVDYTTLKNLTVCNVKK